VSLQYYGIQIVTKAGSMNDERHSLTTTLRDIRII